MKWFFHDLHDVLFPAAMAVFEVCAIILMIFGTAALLKTLIGYLL